MNDPIKATLEAARANGANTAPYTPPAAGTPAANTPTVYQPTGSALAPAAPRGHSLSVSTMQGGGGNSLSVDNFLGVEKQGVVVRFANDDPRKAVLGQQALRPLILHLDYAKDVAPKYSLRVNTPSGIKFFHSYDRVMAADGVTPWEALISKCKQGDPKCKGDYPSIDIAGTLLEDAVTQAGQVVIPAGKRVGFSTSTMNWKEYQQLHQQLVATDMVIEYDDNTMEGMVVIRLGQYIKTNAGGIQYGAFTFECLGDGKAVVLPAAAANAAAAPAQPAAPVVQPTVNTAAYVPGAAAAAPTQPGFGTAASTAAPAAAETVAANPPTGAGTIPGVGGGAQIETGQPATKRRSRKAAGTDQ